MKIAIVIGHKESSGGAYNKKAGINEFTYNEILASYIHTNINSDIVYRNSYRDLPDEINELNPDYIISLHCNAYNKQVSGTETLYYHSSKRGKQLATLLQEEVVDCLRLNDRGIKPKHSEDRGGYLLRYTNAPCVILEPFFIDNDNDFLVGMNNIENLGDAILRALSELNNVR